MANQTEAQQRGIARCHVVDTLPEFSVYFIFGVFRDNPDFDRRHV